MIKKQSIVALVGDLKEKRAKIDEVIKLLGSLYGIDGTEEVAEQFEMLAGEVKEQITRAVVPHVQIPKNGTVEDHIRAALAMKGKLTSRELYDLIVKRRPLKITSVYTTLNQMAKKGIVSRDDGTGSYSLSETRGE